MVPQKMIISVALCTYNGEKYLESQLNSILNQTVKVDEIVICDDVSSDTTMQIINEYKKRFPTIFNVIVNEKNIGYVKNFDKAITICTGDLILLSDQDDLWKRNKVETILNTAQSNNSKEVFCHDIEILNEDGSIINTSFWQSPGFNHNFNNRQILEYILFERNVFPGMTLAITKCAKKKYFPLKKPNSTIIHDYEIILKACNNEDFMIIPEALALYRLHADQNIGFGNLEKPEMSKDEIYLKIKRITFVEDVVEKLNLEPDLVKKYKNQCIRDYKNYIRNLKFPLNLFTHFKMKYYYKILNFDAIKKNNTI